MLFSDNSLVDDGNNDENDDDDDSCLRPGEVA
jgi:hypothetical protein